MWHPTIQRNARYVAEKQSEPTNLPHVRTDPEGLVGRDDVDGDLEEHSGGHDAIEVATSDEE